MKRFYTSLLLIIHSVLLLSQSGSIDSTFGTDGRVITTFIANQGNLCRKMAIASDGSIYLCGHTLSFDNVGPVFDKLLISKYLNDGSLDASFGSSGLIITESTNDGQEALISVAVQPDNKPVFAGWINNNDTVVGLILRLNVDGSFDTTFNSSGVVSVYPQANARFNDILVQPDGKILAVGEAYNNTNSIVFALRLNVDGSLDTTFNGSGAYFLDIPNSILTATCLTLYNNKIYIGGMASSNFRKEILLVGLNNDGSPISGFGNNGAVVDFISDDYLYNAYDIEVGGNGNLVIVGSKTAGVELFPLVVGYNSDGSRNTTFGNLGEATLFDGQGVYYGISKQTDDKFIVAGYLDFVTTKKIVNRIDEIGNLDVLFGDNGTVLLDNVGIGDIFTSCAIQQDDKIVCAGAILTNDTARDFIVIRFLSGLEVGTLEFTLTETAPLLYPNPVQQVETLKYTLAENETISISLIDATGKLVQTFIENENQAMGNHEQVLNFPTNLAKGSYYLVISSPKGKTSIKLMN